jgi:hypothetical protein
MHQEKGAQAAPTEQPNAGSLDQAFSVSSGVTTTYSGGRNPDFGGDCNTPRPLTYFYPTDTAYGATLPVFIYTVGTDDAYDSSDAISIAQAAAAQGFIGATVAYDNGLGNVACGGTNSNAHCIYGSADAQTSAVELLCALSNLGPNAVSADCTGKGIGAAGHSQGGGVAVRAKNHDSRVRAAWTIGTGSSSLWDTSCFKPNQASVSDRALVAEKYRAYAGFDDINKEVELNGITGLTCAAGTANCLTSNTSAGYGWYRIQQSELGGPPAVQDHCPHRVAGCSGDHTINVTWSASTAYQASLTNSLAWMKTKLSEP